MANQDQTRLRSDKSGGLSREDVMDFVEKRIGDQDRRRDDSLSFKIASVEKLFQMTIEAKSDALATAISRIQGESKACATRCNNQVKEFYIKIESLRTRVQKIEFIDKTLAHDLAEIEDVAKENREIIETLLDQEIALVRAELNSVNATLNSIDKWRENFWLKNILTILVTTVVVGQILMQGLYWLVDLVRQTMQAGGV